VVLGVLVVDGMFQPGFRRAASFLFSPRPEQLDPAGVIEALGQSFFTLSLGMGALLTYGSYLPKDRDIVGSSVIVAVLDTVVALCACLVIFPIIFSFDIAETTGPGLVFQSMPVALGRMAGGMVLSIFFFVLLFFAALTSAISLLEVVVSTMIDQLGWSRPKTVLITGALIFVFGIPSALSGSGAVFSAWTEIFGKNFFDTVDSLATGWILPLGGLFIAIFVGWVLPDEDRVEEFQGSRLARLYPVWIFALRYIVPGAIFLLWLFSVEILPKAWLVPEP
jgi:NSS family neurotransmitter:Na+ symporter